MDQKTREFWLNLSTRLFHACKPEMRTEPHTLVIRASQFVDTLDHAVMIHEDCRVTNLDIDVATFNALVATVTTTIERAFQGCHQVRSRFYEPDQVVVFYTLKASAEEERA